MRNLARGFGDFGRGFAAWRSHPRLMTLGLIPAVLAGIVLIALLVPYVLSLGTITAWLTPFADGWPEPWRTILHATAGVMLFVAALFLAASVFTGLALTIGDGFYDRIVRRLLLSATGSPATGDTPFWQGARDGLKLAFLGLLVALCTLALGVIPLVGGAIGFLVGLALSGRLLATELLTRVFTAMSVPDADRKSLLRAHRWRVLGFGICVQLCSFVPLGPIVTMPSVMAAATFLGASLAGTTPHAPGSASRGSARDA